MYVRLICAQQAGQKSWLDKLAQSRVLRRVAERRPLDRGVRGEKPQNCKLAECRHSGIPRSENVPTDGVYAPVMNAHSTPTAAPTGSPAAAQAPWDAELPPAGSL